jgi:CRP/FNR family transcriptional regulator, nitrogen oxide reductase regulator
MSSSAPCSITAVKCKLFEGLDDSALKHIHSAAQIRSIAPKKNITIKGGRPDHLFLLRAGRARSYIVTESGSEVLLLWLVPGDIVGLVSLLASPPNYMANGATVTECEFLIWNHDTIRRLAKSYPQLTENGFRLALRYLGVFIKRHTSVMTKTAESRLAHALLQLATEGGEVQQSGVAIDITNEQLGSLSDISPFTASRLLSKWERDGMLSKERGRVTLLAPESLMIAGS